MERTRPPDRTRTAQPQERARTTQPPPPAAARPAAPQMAAPPVQGAVPENLAIGPTLAGPAATSLAFDFEVVMMGSNRSCACAVSARDAAPISVTLTQGLYRRSYSGDRIIKTGPVPPAPAGTEGSLTARNVATGESVTYVWKWMPGPAASPPPPSRGGLLSKLFSRAKTGTALPRARPKQLTLAERLGPRVAQAFSLQFFGQEATGQRFAFILDKSGSMYGARWKACVTHLTRALRVMPPHVEFAVVLFESTLSEPPQQTGWLKAEHDQVEAVVNWLATQSPCGGTREMPAFERVFSFAGAPDVIYFLTDGFLEELGPGTCERIRGTAPTVINTIALENDAGRDVLAAIAEQTGGQFIVIQRADEGAA